MLAERFRNLVYSIQRHGARSGLELRLTNDPDHENIPLVFDVMRQADAQTIAVMMAFPPTDPFVNSDVISFLVREMRRAETLEAFPVLLFLDTTLPQVDRALTSAGIKQRSATLTYTRTRRGYEMDWILVDPGAESA